MAIQTRFWERELGGVPQNNLNLEALNFGQRFFLPNHSLTKTVSKHVTDNHGYSIQYNRKYCEKIRGLNTFTKRQMESISKMRINMQFIYEIKPYLTLQS